MPRERKSRIIDVVVCLFLLLALVGVTVYAMRPINNQLMLSAELGRGSSVGNIQFTVFNRWDCRRVVFTDDGFDGVLDSVLVTYKDGEIETIYLKIADYEKANAWKDRYLEVRKEATEIKERR